MWKTPIFLAVMLIFSIAPFLPLHQEDQVTQTTLGITPLRSVVSADSRDHHTPAVEYKSINNYFVFSEATGPHMEPGFDCYVGFSRVAAFTGTGVYLIGANSVAYSEFGRTTGVNPIGQDQLATVFSSFSSSVRSASALPTFASIAYENLWPGISLVYYVTAEGLKYEYLLSPGARIEWIKLRVEGQNVSVSETGDKLTINGIEDSGLLAWQGDGKMVDVRFSLDGDLLSFEVTEPFTGGLTIDPLIYSTFLGGYNPDEAVDVAVDENGSAYVTGWTISSDFPTVPGSYDTTFNGKDTFIAKLAPNGSYLEYSTFYGLSGTSTVPFGIDLIDGSAIVVGGTDADIPTTGNAFNTSFNGGSSDAFVMRLSPNGTTLEFSTYFGGSGDDMGHGIAFGNGSIHITGESYSSDLPTTPGALQPTLTLESDAFIAEIASDGTALINCTYLGGNTRDVGESIAVDVNGTVYVVGWTKGWGFPTTGSGNSTFGGDVDIFLSVLSANGTTLELSTYLGGSHRDFGLDIITDQNGTSHVTGSTRSVDWPTTSGALQRQLNGDPGIETYDAIYCRFHTNGTLLYSTFLGDAGFDEGYSIALDDNGIAYVAGVTESVDFPAVSGSYDVSYGGNEDAFLVVFSENGDSLIYGTFLGNSQDDAAGGVAVDVNGTAYMVGYTKSSNYPVTAGALDESYNGGPEDCFVTVIGNLTALGWPNVRILSTTPLLDLSEYFIINAYVSDDRIGGAGVSFANLTFDGIEYSMTNITTPENWNWTTSLLMNATQAGREILYNIWAGTVDGFSNSTPSYTVLVGTYPSLSNVSAQSTKTEDTTWRITAVVTDSRPGDRGIDEVRVLFDGDYYDMSNDSNEWVWSHLLTEEAGTYEWRIEATDLAGNVNASNTRTLRITRAPGVGVEEAEAGEAEPEVQPSLPPAPDWLEVVGWYLFFAIMAMLALLSAWAYTSKATRPAHWRPFLGFAAMFVAIGVVVMGLMGAASWLVIGGIWGLVSGAVFFVARFGEKRKVLRHTIPLRSLGIAAFLAGSATLMILLGLGLII